MDQSASSEARDAITKSTIANLYAIPFLFNLDSTIPYDNTHPDMDFNYN